MGVSWTIWPLDDEIRPVLDDMGIDYPDAPSRWPTGAELKATLAALSGFEIEAADNGPGGPFSATLYRDETHWALLQVSDFAGDHLAVQPCFEKGHEAVIRPFIARLAIACGPLVAIVNGEEFEVILAASPA